MMRYEMIGKHRRGSILPLVAVCLVSLVGFIALAIDVGIMQIGRTQCQNVADAAALVSARKLTGDVSNNYSFTAANPAAINVANANKILGQSIDTKTHLQVKIGTYRYDSKSDKFLIDTPTTLGANDSWSLVKATVAASPRPFFAPVLSGGASGAGGVTSLPVSATATAAHRPRDVSIIIDLSGSMRLASAFAYPLSGARTQGMNNETVYPAWSQYSAAITTWRGANNPIVAIQASTGELVDLSNLFIETAGGPAVVEDFFQDTSPFGTSSKAFTAQPSSYKTAPAGDLPRLKSGSSAYATNLNEVMGWTTNQGNAGNANSAAFKDTQNGTASTDGYGSTFAGYTVGPNYWGKTFHIWPPDSRGPTTTAVDSNNLPVANNGAKDWRKRFFFKVFLGVRNTNTYTAPPTSTTGTSGSTSSSSGSTSSSSTSSSSTSSPPPPPPPPGLNVRREKTFYNVTSTFGMVSAAQVPSQTATTVGTRSPLDITSLMWNGVYDLSATVSSPGNGSFVRPGVVSSYKVYDTTVTNANGSTNRYRNYIDMTYGINYDAIIYWLKNSGTNPFPSQLRAGGILYYDSIPDSINSSVHPNPTNANPTFPLPTTTQAQRNIRFWKDYIDFVFGLEQAGIGSTTNSGVTARYATYNSISNNVGYKDYFSWTSASPSGIWQAGHGLSPYMSLATQTSTISTTLVADTRFMNYADNPRRGTLHFWFGPMTFLDYINNPNRARYWLPGTTHDAPTWQCKAGVQAAINDIKTNHPNDMISLIAFSSPEGYTPSTTALQAGAYNAVRSPLGRDYNKIINSLYFSPTVIQTNQEIHPYHSRIRDVPRAFGGTCYAMGLMLAYNQFSRCTVDGTLRTYSPTGVTGQNGGLGRRGAQKIIIFETDGVNTSTAYAPNNMTSVFTNGGVYNSYFKVRYDVSGSTLNEYPPYLSYDPVNAPLEPANQAKEVLTRICSADTNASAPGFSTPKKPVRCHCIAFGSLFDAVANPGAATTRNQALALLQEMQFIGGTQASASAALDSSKIIIGSNYTTRIDKLRQAFATIMQDGYSVTLIE